ncbi:putative RTA1 domain protein [Stachybotrys elegans]|uniref:RTA1 domain protein n=1 Tax=Stachybotrys elegans TaxID=80388 RepID=A0A8K0WSG7_9HYPO|nr:putative RTA1 domain protein [Stachybotrys elegans]
MSDSEYTGGRRPFDECHEVSAFCPVEATVLGYYPNLGSGIFFTIGFGSLFIAAAILSVWKRTWSFGGFICAGLVLEMSGYIGRILLNDNPWNSDAFQLQICAIIIGPTLLCVSLYLTLKHVALHLSAELSRIRPKWYPFIFLPADLCCLCVQAIGGGLAAAAGRDNISLLNGGNNAIIAGIVLQVVVLLFFGITSADYLFRVKKHFQTSSSADPTALALWNSPTFRRFLWAVGGAYFAILTRCIYRIAEMALGWGNHIMQDEPSFLVLDSTLMFVATFLLTAFHPGLFFPQMSNSKRVSASEKQASTLNNETGDSSNEGVKTSAV